MVTTKTWKVVVKSEDWYYYEVEGKDYEEALDNAQAQFSSEQPQDWDTEFTLEEEDV